MANNPEHSTKQNVATFRSDIGIWQERPLTLEELRVVQLDSLKTVCIRTELCRAQVYELMKQKRFPRPIKISPGRRGAVRWPDIWINEWLKLAIESAVQQGGAR